MRFSISILALASVFALTQDRACGQTPTRLPGLTGSAVPQAEQRLNQLLSQARQARGPLAQVIQRLQQLVQQQKSLQQALAMVRLQLQNPRLQSQARALLAANLQRIQQILRQVDAEIARLAASL